MEKRLWDTLKPSSRCPTLDTIDGIAVLQALSDPVRLEIVRQLAGCAEDSDLKCGQIELPVTKSTASHHFKILRAAGVDRRARAGHEQVHAPAPRRARRALPGPARLGAARDRDCRLSLVAAWFSLADSGFRPGL